MRDSTSRPSALSKMASASSTIWSRTTAEPSSFATSGRRPRRARRTSSSPIPKTAARPGRSTGSQTRSASSSPFAPPSRHAGQPCDPEADRRRGERRDDSDRNRGASPDHGRQPAREAQADGQTHAHQAIPPLTPNHRDQAEQREKSKSELGERLRDLSGGPRLAPLVYAAIYSGPRQPEKAQNNDDEKHAAQKIASHPHGTRFSPMS